MSRAVILAGGEGTRLRPYTTVLPKPLMPIGERSILEIVLLDTMYDLPSLDGVDEVVINREVIEGRAQPLYVHGERKEGIAAAPA